MAKVDSGKAAFKAWHPFTRELRDHHRVTDSSKGQVFHLTSETPDSAKFLYYTMWHKVNAE